MNTENYLELFSVCVRLKHIWSIGRWDFHIHIRLRLRLRNFLTFLSCWHLEHLGLLAFGMKNWCSGLLLILANIFINSGHIFWYLDAWIPGLLIDIFRGPHQSVACWTWTCMVSSPPPWFWGDLIFQNAVFSGGTIIIRKKVGGPYTSGGTWVKIAYSGGTCTHNVQNDLSPHQSLNTGLASLYSHGRFCRANFKNFAALITNYHYKLH